MSRRKKTEEEIKNRGPLWNGYYTRKTKTKREKEIQEQRRKKNQRKWLSDSEEAGNV